MALYEIESCMCGYHVYKDIWTAMIGEDLLCERKPFNDVDRYAIAVLKDDTIVGHIPKNISRICSLFIARGGGIACTPIGGRDSADLSQGGLGLETPCKLVFAGKQREVEKLLVCKGIVAQLIFMVARACNKTMKNSTNVYSYSLYVYN